MKREAEKKSITKSIKLSPNQEELIMRQAGEKNMNFSQYVLDCAMHPDSKITPEIAVNIQNILGYARLIAEKGDNWFLYQEKFEKMEDAIWELLK